MEEQSKGLLWAGRVLTGLTALGLTMSAVMKLSHQAPVVQQFTTFGYPPGALTPIGIVELACVVIYLVPQTAVLGAILITGYLGGAVATHVRVDNQFVPALVLGVLAWAGLYARERRLRALLPLRR